MSVIALKPMGHFGSQHDLLAGNQFVSSPGVYVS